MMDGDETELPQGKRNLFTSQYVDEKLRRIRWGRSR